MTNPYNKILIMLNAYDGTLPEYAAKFNNTFLEPLTLLKDDVHDIPYIYSEAFASKKEDAKELLEYLLVENKQKDPLVFKIVEELNQIPQNVVTVNASLLSNNDISFIYSLYSNIIVVSEVGTNGESLFIVGDLTTGEIGTVRDPKGIAKWVNYAVKEAYGVK